MEEGILGLVVSRANGLLVPNHVDYAASHTNVEDFHTAVVQRIVSGEEIKIASNENKQEELVSSKRDASSILCNTQT